MPPTNTIATPPISRYAMVDTLATLARHHHPVTLSPTLQVPSALFSTAAAPLQHLTCTLLHPHTPSCVLANVSFFLGSTPRLARFFTLIFALFSLPRYRTLLSHPLSFLNRLARTVLRTTVSVSGSIGTSWGMICAFQRLLPGHLLPTQRYFLGGFLGGLWGFVERRGGRAQFLYTARASIDSLWKVGRKRGWWRGVRNGDVWVFVASLALINGVFELDPRSATGSVVRRGLETMRGRAMLDPTRSMTQKEEVMSPAIEGGEALRQ